MFRQLVKSGATLAFGKALGVIPLVLSSLLPSPVAYCAEMHEKVLIPSSESPNISINTHLKQSILTTLKQGLPIRVLFHNAARAQSTATLRGRVIDPHGAVLMGAKVTVSNREMGLERVAQTDGAGDYQFAALPVGLYVLEVRAGGFRTAIV